MPYIDSKVNIEVTGEQRNELKEQLGKAIELIPGKTEQFLMINLQDGSKMYFRGSNDMGIAYINLKSFGQADKEVYENLTAKICEIYETVLGIHRNNIYITYDEITLWGWNGRNF